MKVLSIPFAKKNNPYQVNLANALAAHDIKTVHAIKFNAPVFSITRNLLNNRKIDLIHLHWLHPFMTDGCKVFSPFKSILFLLEMLIAKMWGLRIVWTVHNITPHDTETSRLELAMIRLFTKLSDILIVHSEHSRFHIVEKLGTDISKIHVIPHGHYINNIESNPARDQARESLGIDRNNFVILCFGRIRPYKGILDLLETFTCLPGKHLNLLIVGKPALNLDITQLKKIAADDRRIIIIPEFIDNKKIATYMNAADIVALPYRDILTSGAVIMAMSHARAVVAPALGNIPELIDDQGGFLYEPGNPEGLKQALVQSMDSDLEAMGRHNYKLAKDRLDWNKIADMTLTAYRASTKKSSQVDIKQRDY